MFFLAYTYSLRKNFKWFKFIKLRTYVNWHIIIGIMAIILIAFHSNMKFTRAISLWIWISLIFLVLSGLFGQYLFLKLPREKSGLEEDLEHAFAEKEAAYFKILSVFSENEKVLEALKDLDHIIYTIQKTPKEFILMMKTDYWIKKNRRQIRADLKIAITDEKMFLETNALFQKYLTIHLKLHYLEMTKKVSSYWLVFHKGYILFTFFLIAIHVISVWKTFYFRDLPII